MTTASLFKKLCYFYFENLEEKNILTNFAVFCQSFKLMRQYIANSFNLYNKNTDVTTAAFMLSLIAFSNYYDTSNRVDVLEHKYVFGPSNNSCKNELESGPRTSTLL